MFKSLKVKLWHKFTRWIIPMYSQNLLGWYTHTAQIEVRKSIRISDKFGNTALLYFVPGGEAVLDSVYILPALRRERRLNGFLLEVYETAQKVGAMTLVTYPLYDHDYLITALEKFGFKKGVSSTDTQCWKIEL